MYLSKQNVKKPQYYQIFVIITLLGLTLLGLWFWEIDNFFKRPLYVAVVGPMANPNGKAMVQGVELALKQVNEQGGIRGQRVKLLPFNDEDQSTLAVAKAKEIVKSPAVAVIGHYSSNPSLAAAKIYQQHGIPAISGSTTADQLTIDNDWYFRVIFNNSDQGALLAYYVHKILGYDQASILFDQDKYGSNLKDAFVSTARTIGLKIHQQWDFNSNNSDSFKQTLAAMIDTLRADQGKENTVKPILFLATHSTEAAKTVIELKHQQVSEIPIIGADALSSKNFNDIIKNELREQYQPGYYTDGIYLVTPFIPDLAGKRAVDFDQIFKENFGKDSIPPVTAILYYDATQVILEALKKLPTNQVDLHEKRQQLQSNLWGFSDYNHAVKGVTGPIYFDKNGNVDKPIAISRIEHGKPVVAWSQYGFRTWNVHKMTPSILKTTLSDVFAERLLKINSKFRRKTDVVYVGFEFNDIKQLDTKDMSYILDFYIWFRFKPESDQENCQPSRAGCQKGRFAGNIIEFVNIVNPQDGTLAKPENIYTNYSFIKNKEGIRDSITEIYRVKALFKGNFDFHAYPLDHQILSLQLRHHQTRDTVIFAVDTQGMRSDIFVEKVKNSNAFSIYGWQIAKISSFEDIQEIDSTFGATQFFHSQHKLEYSRLNVEIEIKRHVISFFWKNLFPTTLLIILGYGIFYIKDFEIQVSLGTNLILPTSVLHIQLAETLPTLSYFTMLEYVFYLIYLLAVFSLALVVIMHLHEYDKKYLERVNRIGRISYPILVFISMALIYDATRSFL